MNRPATAETPKPAAEKPKDAPEGDEGGERLPFVVVGTNHWEINDYVISLLPGVAGLYQRGGELSRVVVLPPGEVTRQPRIAPLHEATLDELITTVVEFEKPDRHGVLQPVDPPGWCIKGVMHRRAYPGLPVLRSIVNYPVLRPDGTILQTKGYDAASCLLYEPTCEYLPVSDRPTPQETQQALTRLMDLVAQFPFQTLADRAAYLAGLLTPFARHAFNGPVPCFVITANSPRTGKTKLVNIASLIYSGEYPSLKTQTDDEAEERKRINDIAEKGEIVVLFDDIGRRFGNKVLDAALTAMVWGERTLGQKDCPKYPLLWVPWVTANRFSAQADTYKRILPIKLRTNLEKPEFRADLQDLNIESTVLLYRADLVWSCLTLLRSYFVHGREKKIEIPFWHTFPAWSAVIRNTIVWLGLPDPFQTHLDNTEDADSTLSAVRNLVLGWAEMLDAEREQAATTRDAHRWMSQALEESRTDLGKHHPLRHERLISALQELCPRRRGELPEAGQIGLLLRNHEDRIVEGKRVRPVSRVNSGSLWGIDEVANG